MHTNVLKRAGVKAERGAALLIPGTLSEWVVFVNVHDVVTDKKDSSVVGGFFKPRQEAAEGSAVSPLAADRFLETEMAISFAFTKKTKKH